MRLEEFKTGGGTHLAGYHALQILLHRKLVDGADLV